MSVEFDAFCKVANQEIPVKLYYSSDDPATVFFTFHNVGQRNTSPKWIFARDLVKEALETGDAGEGDVRVEAEQNTVMFWFSSPEGDAMASFERPVIEEFVEFVYDEVPEGEDHYEIPDEFPEEWLV